MRLLELSKRGQGGSIELHPVVKHFPNGRWIGIVVAHAPISLHLSVTLNPESMAGGESQAQGGNGGMPLRDICNLTSEQRDRLIEIEDAIVGEDMHLEVHGLHANRD